MGKTFVNLADRVKEAAIALTYGSEAKDLQPLTIAAMLTQAEAIGGLVWASLTRNHKGFEKDPNKILKATKKKRLWQEFEAALSADFVVERLEQTATYQPQKRSQVLRVIRWLGKCGLLDKEHRDMHRLSIEEAEALQSEGDWRRRAGQVKAGKKTGKQHICEYMGIDFEGLMIQVLAIIKVLKETPVADGDGFEAFMPTHKCGFLNEVFKKMGGIGSIYSGWDAEPPEEEEIKHDEGRTQIMIAGLSQAIDEDFERFQRMRKAGYKPSPDFWRNLKSMQLERNRLMRHLKRLKAAIVDALGSVAIGEEFEAEIPF